MRCLFVVGSLLAVAGCMPVATTASGQPLRYPVYFPEASTQLDDEGHQVVKAASLYANSHPLSDVVVLGFADPNLVRQDGVRISRDRAQIVSDELVADGVAASRIRRDGVGGTPYAFSRIESRRVEISVVPR